MDEARRSRGSGLRGGPIIISGGMPSDTALRKQLIQDTIVAYFKVDPVGAKDAIDYMKSITQVEINGGKWSSGKGQHRMSLPATLWHSLRKVFNMYAPDEPPFGQDSNDVNLVIQVCPDLTREGANARSGRGKGR